VMGAILLGGCAAKQNAASGQVVSAQEDKDSAACLEALNNGSYDENKKAFASCMRVRGHNENKQYPSETTANAGKPLVTNVSTIAREGSPGLAATEDYERAVANYNNCILDHTSNLSACEKQQAIMNALGKVSSRSPLSQSYQTTSINTAGITQGANAAQATLSQVPAGIPQTPQATPSQTPAPIAPPTTSSRMPAPISLAPPTN